MSPCATIILHAALCARHTLGHSISLLSAKRPDSRVRVLPRGLGHSAEE